MLRRRARHRPPARLASFRRRRSPSRFLPSLALLLCVALQLGCASPTSRLRALAAEQGFERRTIAAGGFDLTVFENAALAARDGAVEAGKGVLHVYLEGDGTPWMYHVLVTADPTPRRPLMLQLMALDPSPAVYVGRPCYNGTSRDEGCEDELWTSARYSALVVDSMAAGVRALLERHDVAAVRLFGHSGGGTLALLLAARVPGTTDVVTVAGNLDPDAWTAYHGYTPLRDSLNPAEEPPLGVGVRQWHLVGGADTVVPSTIVRPFIGAQSNAAGIAFPSFGHGCCWQRVWPGVLRAVRRDRPALLPGSPFRRPSGQAAAPRAAARGSR